MAMRRVWWQYMCMFLFALIGSATFTILTFSPFENVQISAMGKVLETVTSAQDVKVDYTLNLNAEGKQINAVGDFVMETNKETNAVSFNLSMNLNINKTPAVLNVTYAEDIVYLEFNNKSLKFKLGNTLSSIKDISGLLTPLLSEIELPFDAENFSMAKLQGLATSAEEVELEDGFLINFPLYNIIPELGVAVIEANSDYKPTKIYLKPHEETQIENPLFNISFNAETNFEAESTKVAVSEKQKAFADYSKTVSLANLVVGRLSDKQVNANIDFCKNDISINAVAKLLLDPLTAEFNVSAFGANINAVFDGSQVYLSTMGIKLKASINEIAGLFNTSNLDLDITKIKELLEKVKGSSEFSLDKILSMLNIEDNITENDGNMILDINGYNITFAKDEEGKLESITIFENEEKLFSLTFKNETFSFSEINKDDYAETLAVTNKIEFIKQILNTKKVETSLNLSVGNSTFEINGKLDFTATPKAQFNTTLLGKPLGIGFEDSTVYISYGLANLCLNIKDIPLLASSLSFALPKEAQEIIVKLQSFSIDDIKSLIPQIDLSSFDVTNYIQNITLTSSEFGINMPNGNYAKFQLENNIMEVLFNDVLLEGSVAVNKDLTIDINKEKFSNLTNLAPIIDFANQVVSHKKLSSNIKVVAGNQTINANFKVDANCGYVEFATQLYGKEIQVVIKDQVVYLTFDGLNISCPTEELTKFIPNLNFNTFDIDYSSIILNIIDSLKLFLNSSGLNLSIANANLKVEYKNDKLTAINLNYNGSSILLNNFAFDFNQQNIDETKFISFKTLKSAAEGLKEYIGSKTYAFDVNTTLNNQNLTLNVVLDLRNEVKAKISTTIPSSMVYQAETSVDVPVSIILDYETIYAQIAGYKFSAKLSDAGSVLEFINKFIEVDQEQITNIINTITPYLSAPWANIQTKLGELMESVSISNLTFSLDMLENLKDISLSLTQIENSLTLNASYLGSEFGFNLENNTPDTISLNLNPSTLEKFGLDKLNSDITANITFKPFEEITKGEEKEYIKISNALKLVNCLDIVSKNKAITGNGSATFEFLNETHNIEFSYGIDLSSTFKGFVNTTFKGLSVSLIVEDEIIYANIAGLKVNLPLSEIDNLINWANSTFNANISQFNINDLIKQQDMDVVDIIFNQITNFSLTSSELNVVYNNLCINATFSQIIESIHASNENFSVTLETSFANTLSLNYDKADYETYTTLTDSITALISTVKSKQYNLIASADVFDYNSKKYTGTMNLVADLTSDALIAGSGTLRSLVNNNETYSAKANFENGKLYVDYKSLKLCASQESLKQLLVIALQALGIDPDSIGILGAIDDDFKVDMGNIKDTINININMENPLNMLEFIKGLKFENNIFTIILDGGKISPVAEQQGKDMTISLTLDDGKFSKINLSNIFTGVTQGENFNLEINLNQFNGVTPLTNSEKASYIDISGSSQLLKALVNTTNLNDYHISGKLKINATVIGINIPKTVDVDVKIKKEESGINGVIAITNIPTVTAVNDDLFSGIDHRNFYIYIAGEYAYLHRVDIRSGTDYEYQVKLTLDQLMADPLYYFLEFGIGLKSNIMEKIYEDVEACKVRDGPMDMGNILKKYTNNGSNHTIQINMQEISNNKNLGLTDITITTINSNSTGNKDYLYKFDFNMNMPIASVLSIDISTDSENTLKLVDISKEVNVDSIKNFAKNYAYGEAVEIQNVGKGWERRDMANYDVYFNTNGGNNVSTLNAKCGTKVTLPIPTKNVYDDGNTKITYTFAGWFKTESLSGKKLTSYVIPRGNSTLYAKWEETKEYYHTISFNTGCSETFASIKTLGGSNITLPTPATFRTTTGNTTTTYQFVCWLDENGNEFNQTIMPEYSAVLTANWEIVNVETTVNLKVVDNGTEVFNDNLVAGKQVEITTFKLDQNTEFYTDQAFTNKYSVENFVVDGKIVVPNENTVLYVRNAYTLTVVSNIANKINETYTVYQNQDISSYLKNLGTKVEDDKKTKQITYTFAGYTSSLTSFANNLMTNNNLTLTASWNSVVKNYYTVTFSKNTYVGSAYKEHISFPVSSLCVLEGETINLSQYTPTWKYTTKGLFGETYYWHYNFEGWATSNSRKTNSITNLKVTKNTTIYAKWNDVVKTN